MSDFKITYVGSNYQMDVTESLTGIREEEEDTNWEQFENFWNKVADAMERKYQNGDLRERK